MRARDERSNHLKYEGFSARDAGFTLARAVSVVLFTAALVEWVGPVGFVAFPPMVWFLWRDLNAEPVVRETVTWLPPVSQMQWLEDADASWQRGTGISTLAVRYDVDPEWLELELRSGCHASSRYREEKG